MRTRETQFPSVFEAIVDKIALQGHDPIAVQCSSNTEASSWRGQFNRWRQLRRKQKPEDGPVLDSIICSVNGNELRFMNRDHTQVALNLARQLNLEV